jgi:hypothetical protein
LAPNRTTDLADQGGIVGIVREKSRVEDITPPRKLVEGLGRPARLSDSRVS